MSVMDDMYLGFRVKSEDVIPYIEYAIKLKDFYAAKRAEATKDLLMDRNFAVGSFDAVERQCLVGREIIHPDLLEEKVSELLREKILRRECEGLELEKFRYVNNGLAEFRNVLFVNSLLGYLQRISEVLYPGHVLRS